MTLFGIIAASSEGHRIGVGLLSEVRVGVDAKAGQYGGQGDGWVAVRAAEAVLALSVDVLTGGVHLGAAPLLSLVTAAVYPVSTGHVGHAIEGEGEDTGASRVWT